MSHKPPFWTEAEELATSLAPEPTCSAAAAGVWGVATAITVIGASIALVGQDAREWLSAGVVALTAAFVVPYLIVRARWRHHRAVVDDLLKQPYHYHHIKRYNE